MSKSLHIAFNMHVCDTWIHIALNNSFDGNRKKESEKICIFLVASWMSGKHEWTKHTHAYPFRTFFPYCCHRKLPEEQQITCACAHTRVIFCKQGKWQIIIFHFETFSIRSEKYEGVCTNSQHHNVLCHIVVTASRITLGEIRKTSNNGDNYTSAVCQASAMRVDVNVTNICYSFSFPLHVLLQNR